MNGVCFGLVQNLIERASDYCLQVDKFSCGATIIDAGVKVEGSRETGRILTEICHGGLCSVSLGIVELNNYTLPQITVDSLHPYNSIYRMQFGHILDGRIISGPLRQYLDSESESDVYPYGDKADAGIAVIESHDIPSNEWVLSLAKKSSVSADNLYLIIAPSHSISGVTQVAGRVNENVLFTMEKSLAYDSRKVRHIIGSVPVAPYSTKGNKERTALPDDFIHYAGSVFITLAADPEDNIGELARNLCFSASSIYGSSFYDLLAEANGVFEDIPDLLNIFKVARVTINEVNSGKVYTAGKFNYELLSKFMD